MSSDARGADSRGLDLRGWRMALLPDALINPPPAVRATLPDVLQVIEACGYGVLQLPPQGDNGLLLAVIADQIAEYSHHGYAVAAIGLRGEPGDGLHWRRLAPLLRHRGTALPPRHIVHPANGVELESRRLSTMLAGYDLPLEERQRWRT